MLEHILYPILQHGYNMCSKVSKNTIKAVQSLRYKYKFQEERSDSEAAAEMRWLSGGEKVNWKQRDNRIVALVAKWRYMNTAQVHYYLFSQIGNGYAKAGERLRSLTKRQKLKRTKVGREYVYHIENWDSKWLHWHEMCNYHIKLEKEKKTWEMLDYYLEFTAGDIRADMFVVKNNVVAKTKSKFFVEIDRATNPFDKVSAYNQLFESRKWARAWWADLNNEGVARFPHIVIVTVRPEAVEGCIRRENKNNLKFITEVIM